MKGYGGPGGVGHEFVPPPADDRDAIICVVVAIFFLGVCIAAAARDLFF